MDSIEIIEKQGLNEILRDLQVVLRTRRGENPESIGVSMDMDPGSVREVLIRLGEEAAPDFSNRRSRILSEKDRLREMVSNWVKLHPGCTYVEISEEFSIPNRHGRDAARDVQYLVLTESHRAPQIIQGPTPVWHRADACAALATAAEISTPLTREKYDELRLAGLFRGPSGAWITSRFASWREACEEAGVQAGKPRRAEYSRKWSPEDMLDWVGRYILLTLDGTALGYDNWAKTVEGAPSGGTIRIQFKSWLVTREKTLLRLRETWAI